MSAIGDYIHYTAFGYNAYGINKIGSERQNAQQKAAALNEELKRIRELVNSESMNILTDQQAKQMANNIQILIKPATEDNEWVKMVWQSICQDLQIQFFQDIPKALLRANKDSSNPFSARAVTRKDVKSHRWGTYKKIVGNLNRAIMAVPEKNKNKQEMKEQLEIVNREYKNLFDLVKAESEQLHKPININRIVPSDPKKNSEMAKQSNNLISAIVKLAKIGMSFSYKTEGSAFQDLIVAASIKATSLTEQEAKKEIKKALQTHRVGDQTSLVKYKSSNFALGDNVASAWSKILQKKVMGEGNEIEVVTSGQSQDKVDVDISFNDKNIKVSAKNINLKSSYDIGLVSEAPLLALIQDMNGDFVNHYLNLNMVHYKGPRPSSPYQPFQGQQLALQIRSQMIMKASLLLSAFIGHKIDTDKASVFIVNNKTASGTQSSVTVYNIGTLMKKALLFINNIDAIATITVDNKVQSTSFTDSMFVSFAATVQDRIINILSKLYSMKVSVGFKKNLLLDSKLW